LWQSRPVRPRKGQEATCCCANVERHVIDGGISLTAYAEIPAAINTPSHRAIRNVRTHLQYNAVPIREASTASSLASQVS